MAYRSLLPKNRLGASHLDDLCRHRIPRIRRRCLQKEKFPITLQLARRFPGGSNRFLAWRFRNSEADESGLDRLWAMGAEAGAALRRVRWPTLELWQPSSRLPSLELRLATAQCGPGSPSPQSNASQGTHSASFKSTPKGTVCTHVASEQSLESLLCARGAGEKLKAPVTESGLWAPRARAVA